jgi:hypothetical protein
MNDRDFLQQVGDKMKPILGFSLLVLFSAPLVVLGEVTLFHENFDDPELDDWSGQGGEDNRPILGEYSSITAHNGYVFLNLSGVDPDRLSGTSGTKFYSTNYFHYAGIEMRVKLSSDNKAGGDIGGGGRRWGFRSGATQYALTFQTMEQGMLPAMNVWYPGNPGTELLGFFVSSRINDKFTFWQIIEGIDLTEWHTYTILWQPEAATFLIDDVVVAMTNEVPQIPMRVYLVVNAGQNLTLPCHTVDQEEICTDEYMQVDYVRVFTSDEKFHEKDLEMSGLITRAHSLISELDQKGENTTNLREQYSEAQDNWREDRRLYNEAKPRLERIIEVMEHWDEVEAMFAQASECIETLKKKGDTRNEKMCEAFYSNAVGTWEQHDYKATYPVLSSIIARCPEPMHLLTLLGLILLSALRRRR